MPDGSSSEAPVIRPGPSDLSNCFRSLAPSSGCGGGCGDADWISTRLAMEALRLREPRVIVLQLANAIGQGKWTDQQHSSEKTAHMSPVRNSTGRRGVATHAGNAREQLQDEPEGDEDPGMDARGKYQKAQRNERTDAAGGIEHEEATQHSGDRSTGAQTRQTRVDRGGDLQRVWRRVRTANRRRDSAGGPSSA